MSEGKAISRLVVRYGTQHIDHETSSNVSANNKKFVVIVRECNVGYVVNDNDTFIIAVYPIILYFG